MAMNDLKRAWAHGKLLGAVETLLLAIDHHADRLRGLGRAQGSNIGNWADRLEEYATNVRTITEETIAEWFGKEGEQE